MRLVGHIGRSLFLLAVILTCSTRAFPSQSIPTKLPLIFESNRGQAPGNVRYLLREGALKGEFLNDGFRLALPGSEKTPSQVQMRLVGARKEAAIDGGGALEGHTNYLLGNDPAHWLRGVPNYAQVRYSQIYSGTDLLFYGNGGALEHDFVLQPGADPSRIAFQLEGAESVTLAENGDLRIGLADGAITFERPIAYQMVAGVRRNVDAAFSVDHDGTVRFQIGSYDKAKKLVIDPVLSFATYLDSLSDGVDAIATDASGNTYITGYTFNSKFPVTSSAYDLQCAACATSTAAVYVTKLNAAGTAQIYSTFLGGSAYNQPIGLAVDSNGNAVVTGRTSSTDFPMKNPISAGLPSGEDGFVTSLAPDGSSLNFSSLLGGTSTQGKSAVTYPGAVAVDASGNVFVSGVTQSPNLPVTPGALDAGTPSYGTDSYVFLTKLQQSGSLSYSALLGDTGMASECCYVTGVTVDSAGNAYVVGTVGVTMASYATSTPITPWPVTTGAYQSAMISPGQTAPFAAKVSADGSKLLYSTLVGTGLTSGMALNSNDQLILVGTPNYNYPVTSNAYSSAVNSSFIAMLSADGSQLLYSSYFGGSESSGTTTNAVTLDAQGNIWLAGSTRDSTFPLVKPLIAQLPPSSLGSATSFLSEFDPTGTQLKFSTFMGDLSGSGLQIALDSSGKVHAAGTTTAPIYTTQGAFIGTVTVAPNNYSYTYPYAVLIDPSQSGATLCLGSSAWGLSFGYLIPQTTLTQSVKVTNCGSAPLTISSIVSSNAAFTVPAGSNGCTGSIAVAGSCTVRVVFEPTAVQAYTGQLTFTSNATIPTALIPLSGSGGAPQAVLATGITFQPLLVGKTSSPALVALYNRGTVPLTINLSQVAITGDFALVAGGNCPASLPAASQCYFAVTFTPSDAGTRTGTLSVPTNDPVNPIVSTTITSTGMNAYPVPTITGLLNPSYPINNGTTPITMSVSGTNFFPASVVNINGVAQTTTYQSSTFLTVTFSPTLLTAVGQLPVTVVNPAPGGGSSAPYPLIEYLSIPLTASALTVDPAGGLLYAAIPSSAAQNPNTVIPINPATGVPGTPIPVGNNPVLLAASSNGAYLYVANATDLTVQRINLQTKTVDRTFTYTPNLSCTSCSTPPASDLKSVPGSPQEVVLAQGFQVSLYNDSGLVNCVPNSFVVYNAPQFNSIAFAGNPLTLYAEPFTSVKNPFFTTVAINSSGLQYTEITGGNNGSLSGTGNKVISDGTLLYTNSGEVWDPSTQKLLGTYLESNGSQLLYEPSVLPDTANGHTYFLDEYAQYDQYQAVNIDVYDQASYALLGTVPFTSIYPPDVTDLVRWGSNGFAFRTVDITGQEPSANQIVIVTSSLIAPSSASPVPIVSSVSPSPVYAGGPSYTMQVTGSGFTSASTVLVNGNPRSTTYISGNSLTVQVLASEIASAGQINVQVTTPAPGGGTSDYVIVSVDPSLQTTPTVTVTPSTMSITTAQPLTVTVAVSGGSGKATPTGSVTLTGGGYSNTQSLSSGSTQFSITAGSLSTGIDTFTANYTPDSNSSSTYNNAAGTSLAVAVTVPANPSPVIGSMLPTFTSAGGAAFTLTVTGSGFVSGSTVYWGTSALTTTYGSATQLTAQVPATDIASAGNTAVTVQTPSPGGGTSSALQFEVDSIGSRSTPPTFTTLTATVTAGSPATYPVTLPSSVESASVTCLNLPTGAACSYSATTNKVTITTTSATPKGTYQITVVFTETVSGAATSWILLPILLLPLVFLRRKLMNRGIWVTACLGMVLLAAAAYTAGCGGGGSSTTTPPPQTHQVVSSGSISIIIQ